MSLNWNNHTLFENALEQKLFKKKNSDMLENKLSI